MLWAGPTADEISYQARQGATDWQKSKIGDLCFCARCSSASSAALPLGCASISEPRPATKPSIIMIMTDDMEVGLVEHMPAVKELIVERGATFSRAYFNDPLCCPSRSTILTGKYAQNTGVTRNSHKQFYEAGNPDRRSLSGSRQPATALRWSASTSTAIPARRRDLRPAGLGPLGGAHSPPKAACSTTTGSTRTGGWSATARPPGDYSTDVYAGQAIAFIKQAVADDVPFFLELSVHAPHVPSTPASRHVALFPEPRRRGHPPSTRPTSATSLLHPRQSRPRPDRLAKIDEHYRHRVRSLQAVDEAVRAIVDVLAKAAGRLERPTSSSPPTTASVHGQHRVDGQKAFPTRR